MLMRSSALFRLRFCTAFSDVLSRMLAAISSTLTYE
jgi:hypothetical protein